MSKESELFNITQMYSVSSLLCGPCHFVLLRIFCCSLVWPDIERVPQHLFHVLVCPFARRELNCEGAKSAALASCSEVRASASWICILALNLSPSSFVGRPAAGSSLSQSCQTAQKGQR